MTEKSTLTLPQVIPLSKYNLNPSRPVKVRTLKDAKRLLSRIIIQLQAGTIKGQDAKDLCYLISTFIQLVRDYELEERIKKLEQIKGITK